MNFSQGLTFDDLLILPQYSEYLPSEVCTASKLHSRLRLKVPIISSAMDTVTEHKMALVMARLGGMGIIHKNMSADSQALEVEKVKKFESGIIQNPLTISPDSTVREAKQLMQKHEISGLPVTVDRKLTGILTHRDLRFETELDELVSSVMTPRDKMITAPVGVDFKKAITILQEHKIEKLPIVNHKDELEGLVTIKDIKKASSFPFATKDIHGRLVVGAAIGSMPSEREEKLVNAGVDLLCIDTAHGYTKNVLNQVAYIKKTYPDVLLMAGNVATKEGALALIEAGADIIKVGMGPGSICTTRVISGVGVPQATALLNCIEVAQKHNVKIVADGGIKFSGDIVKALALGSHTVMVGNLLAGAEESPGETVIYRGRTYKTYRGMGSVESMKKGSKDRYGQEDTANIDKLVPEGIEGRVAYSGSAEQTVEQLAGGLRAGMGYVGAANIEELQNKAQFIQISSQGLRESHIHDVSVTREAPNYRLE